MCLAAPVFLARIGELTVRAAILASLPLLGLLTVLGFYVSVALRDGLSGLSVAVGGMLLVVMLGVARLRRRPAVEDRIGMHDWAVGADTIDGVGRG